MLQKLSLAERRRLEGLVDTASGVSAAGAKEYLLTDDKIVAATCVSQSLLALTEC